MIPLKSFKLGKNGDKIKLATDGALCDVAPTILELLNIPQPSEMTGKSLIQH